MKLVIATLVSVLSVAAQAQSSSYQNYGWDGDASERASCIDKNHDACVAASGSAGLSTAGGIYAFRKYSQARVFDKANTKILLDTKNAPVKIEGDRISSLTCDVADGDRVAIQYRLSEAKNRVYHINLMESNASSAASTAAMHRGMAAAALIPRTETETYTDSNGQTQTRTVTKGPDMASYAMHSSLAASADREAAEYRGKAAAARAGGPVPWYEFDEVIGSKTGNRTAAVEFVTKNAREDGKILGITRLPAAQFRQLKAMVWKARGGLAIAAVGAGLAIEELLLGKVTQKMQQGIEHDSVPTLSRNSLR